MSSDKAIIPKPDLTAQLSTARVPLPRQAVATCQLSPKGELLEANSAFYQLTGISKNNPETSFMQSFVHPLDYPLLNRKFLLAATTGKTYEAHVRLLRSENNDYQTLSFKLQSLGQVIAVEAVPESATQLSFYQGLLQLNSPVIIFDDKYNLLKVNSACCELLGYMPEDLESIDPIALVAPESLPEFTQAMRQIIRKEVKSFEIHIKLKHKLGHELWVNLNSSLVKSGKENEFIVSLLQNISTIKGENQHATEESKNLRNLLDKVGQDIKGPLRSLMALHHIVEMEYGDNPQVMEYFNHYHSSISQLSKVVDDLLTLNQLTNKQETPTDINFRSLVQKCLQNLSGLEGFYKVDFDIRVDLNKPIVLEKRLITTIIHNLLENAVRYADFSSTPKVRVGIWQRQQQLTLEIADNGLGIPDDLQDTIFNMFTKATTQNPGAGLGLFIVKSAIEKLGGTIRLRSKARQGTWFKIYIPL